MAADPEAHELTPRRLALLLAGLAVLGALTYWRLDDPVEPKRKLVSLAGETMGTTYTVKAIETDDIDLHWAELRFRLEPVLASVNALMSTYDPHSELSRLNASDSTRPQPISPETAEVLAAALKVSEQTLGAFDVTLGPIVNAYGFGPDEPDTTPPTEAELEALRQHVGYELLELEVDAGTLRKAHPRVYIDLSALAKGYAVDRLARVLDAANVTDYLVEIGGETRAKGRNADGVPWRIGIETPTPGERGVQRVIALEDMALATSGDYRNYYEENGERISHTIDGRTGRPIRHNLVSASVLHEECMWADAYATAILALGPEDGYILAEILDLPALLLISEPDGSIRERATPAFSARFDNNTQDAA